MRLMRNLTLVFLLFLLAGFSACAVHQSDTDFAPNEGAITAPVAKKVPHTTETLGDIRVDDYFWLREKTNPEVIAYLEAENAYTQSMMSHTTGLQEKLYREMRGHIKEDDLSVPVKIDNYYYYDRTEQGGEYAIHCRKKGDLDAPEEVLLDENALAAQYEYFYVEAFQVSPNHKLLAFSVDTDGSEKFTVLFKNLTTGEMLPDKIANTSGTVEWANDNATVFYTVREEGTERPFKLFRHKLGAAEDVLVYHETDDSFHMGLYKTKTKSYLVAYAESMVTTEMRVLDANDPTGVFQIVEPRKHKVQYSVEHRNGFFYLLTNDDGAKNYKLVKVPINKPGKKNWREAIPHNPAVKLDGIDLFENHLVVYARENGLRTIRVIDLRTDKSHDIEFGEPVYSYMEMENPDFRTNLLRFTYTSLVTPDTVYDYNLDTHERDLKKRKEVPGGYNPEDYESERVFAIAPDGTKVPISLVYKKGMTRNGANPLYLYGYGAYGITIDPRFKSNRLSLLDRGFIFAIAHLRGGGAMGRQWYEDGKMLRKKNTFTDFIACAEHLIAEKYTNKSKLVISGASAGGLLIGAVANMRPDLFGVVVADVPFVDVLNTMLDSSIPLTVIEWEEWGNPNEKPYYDYIKSYAPYENVTEQAYPDMLITAGLNDTRVFYWEPAKLTAKLRANKKDDNLLLLRTNMGAGHFGASGRFEYLREIAFEYAFILDRLGIHE